MLLDVSISSDLLRERYNKHNAAIRTNKGVYRKHGLYFIKLEADTITLVVPDIERASTADSISNDDVKYIFHIKPGSVVHTWNSFCLYVRLFMEKHPSHLQVIIIPNIIEGIAPYVVELLPITNDEVNPFTYQQYNYNIYTHLADSQTDVITNSINSINTATELGYQIAKYLKDKLRYEHYLQKHVKGTSIAHLVISYLNTFLFTGEHDDMECYRIVYHLRNFLASYQHWYRRYYIILLQGNQYKLVVGCETILFYMEKQYEKYLLRYATP